MAKVVVTVTSKQVGTWTIAPYNHIEHLEANTVYEVPIYEVTVGAPLERSTFKAVRFGLVRDNKTPPPKVRGCVGLADAQIAFPSWDPTYSPHSFDPKSRIGAWQLYPGQGHFIHEGTSDPDLFIGGSLGCIEIVDVNGWNNFLDVIEVKAGVGCATIGKKQLLKVIIQRATRPNATLVSSR